MIDIVNHQINKKLRLGYDVGKGYITGEEEVLNNIDVMVDNKRIAKEIRHTVGLGRLDIMKELGIVYIIFRGKKNALILKCCHLHIFKDSIFLQLYSSPIRPGR